MSDATVEPESTSIESASEPTPAGHASSEPVYHLLLRPEEVGPATTALRLLISDEAHEKQIRALARAVLASLDGTPDERGMLTVALEAKQMKITHTALRLLLGDLQREQADERAILRDILEKLPDEHSMRAIALD
jgi:ATP-dependent exoDNAse (exonuclease V) alpha subunit